jgi:hypothetical protein
MTTIRQLEYLWARSRTKRPEGLPRPILSIDLTDHDPETFNSYMQCVYGAGVTSPDRPCDADDPLPDLFPLYLLADKLNDLITTNLTMEEIDREDMPEVLPSAFARYRCHRFRERLSFLS